MKPSTGKTTSSRGLSGVRCDECGALTREGKPLCSDHFYELPAAKAALEGFEQRQREIEYIRKHKRVKVAGFAIVQDIIDHLEFIQRSRSIEGLARDLNIPIEVVRRIGREKQFQIVKVARGNGICLRRNTQ